MGSFSFGSKKKSTKKTKSKNKPVEVPDGVIATPDGLTLEDVSIHHPILNDLEEKRKKRIKDQSRQDDKTEVNHHLVLVFDSFAQKQEFVDQIRDVDVIYDMYYNGEEFAAKFGIKLEPTGLPSHRENAMKPWESLVKEDEIEAANQ